MAENNTKQGVAVVDQDGNVGLLDSDDAAFEMQQGTVRQASGEEVIQERNRIDREREETAKQREYGSLGGMAKAAAAGLARGATLGLSDKAAVEGTRAFYGDEEASRTQESLSNLQKYNPGSSLAGEAASFLIPWGTVSKGAGVVGKAAGALAAPLRATEALGAGVARAAGGKVLGLTARGAVEGGLYGLGQAVSEDALGNTQLTAESALASIKGGVLAGALGGAAIGVGQKVASKAAELVRQKLPSSIAQKAALDILRPTSRDMQAITQLHGGADEFGKVILDAVPEMSGKRWASAKITDVAEAIAAKKQQVGQKIGKYIDELDALGTGIRPSKEAIVNQIQEEVLAPLQQRVGFTPEAAKIQNWVNDFIAKTPEAPTFRELKDISSDLNKRVFKEAKNLSGDTVTQELGQVRSIIEKNLMDTGEQVYQAAGKASGLSEYTDAKKLYGTLSKADELAQRAVSKSESASPIGLYDRLATIAGTVAAASTGHAGAVLGGLATGAANKFARERGQFIIADLFGKAAEQEAVKSISAGVNDSITRGVTRFLSGGARAGLDLAVKDDTLDRLKKEVSIAPEQAAERFALANGNLYKTSPKVNTDIAATQANALEFLKSQAPPQPVRSMGANDVRNTVPPPKSEVHKFERQMDIAKSPLTVMKRMQSGSITSVDVDAAKAMYPALIEQMRNEFMGRLTEKGSIPYSKHLMLSTMFEEPTDETFRAERILDFQAVFASQAGEQPGTPPKKDLKLNDSSHMSTTYATVNRR